MKTKKKSISAATSRVKSCVCAAGVYPKSAKTASLHLTPREALNLASKLIIVANSEIANGNRVIITGHTKDNSVSVIRKI